MYIFETKTILNKSLDEVFGFFCKAENLQKLTPPSLNFKIMTPMPIEMKKGTLIDYRIKLYGIPVKWRTEITEWKPPYEFEDSQLKGPYKVWIHRHKFKAIGNKTEMTDIVKYIPKGSPFTNLLNNWFVKNEIKKIFNYRERIIQSIFT